MIVVDKRKKKLLGTSANISKQKYDDLINDLNTHNKIIKPDQLRKIFEKNLGDEQSYEIFPLLVGLAAHFRRTGDDYEKTFSSITEKLRADDEWAAEFGAKWNEVSSRFFEIVTHPIIHLVAKAVDIATDHEKVVDNISIFADMRPVFCERRESIEGYIVLNNLFVSYLSDNEIKKISLMLGYEELLQLQREVNKSVEKLKSIRESTKNSIGDNLYIPGEENIQ